MSGDDIIVIRDVVLAGLLVREGAIITSGPNGVAMERANNITTGLISYIDDIVNAAVDAALKDAARGEVVTGSFEARTPTGYETAEQHAERVIK